MSAIKFLTIASRQDGAIVKEDAYQRSVKCPSLSCIGISYRFIEVFEVVLVSRGLRRVLFRCILLES